MANGMQEQPQGQPQGGQGQPNMQSLPSDVLTSMAVVLQGFSEMGAPPSALEKIQQALALYEAGLSELSGGGAGGGQAPVSENPEGMPVGPQGV
jgi:hypothetical protein